MKRCATTPTGRLVGLLVLAGAMQAHAQDLRPGLWELGNTSRMNVTTRSNGKTEQFAMRSQGQWLSADCGGIKPMAGGRK